MSTQKIVQAFNDVTQIDLGTPHVATFPDGSRVELPAGTVLREETGGINITAAVSEIRREAKEAHDDPQEAGMLRAVDILLAEGTLSPETRTKEDAQAAGARRHWVTREGYTQLPPAMLAKLGIDTAGGYVWFLPDEQGPAWKVWKEEDLGAVFGERTHDPQAEVLADLTERVGLPREMAPSATPIIDAWKAAGEPATLTISLAEAYRLGMHKP